MSPVVFGALRSGSAGQKMPAPSTAQAAAVQRASRPSGLARLANTTPSAARESMEGRVFEGFVRDEELAKALRLSTTAECVETEEQLSLLRALGVTPQAYRERFASTDAHEGMHAFLGKRAPVFQHR